MIDHIRTPRGRNIVLFCTALLLTFGRTGMLPFLGWYTFFDELLNYLIVVIAPIIAIIYILLNGTVKYILSLLPLVLFAIWVTFRGTFGSPGIYSINQTEIVTCVVSIILAVQIQIFEIKRLRYMLMLVNLIFTIRVLIYALPTVLQIINGDINTRFGVEFSDANVIAFPRTMYTLVFIAFVNFIIESNFAVKFASAILMLIPLLIGLATAGRGPLLALVVIISLFVLTYLSMMKSSHKIKKWTLFILGIGAFYAVFEMVTQRFSLLTQRILEDKDTGRFEIWLNSLSRVSIFGRGRAKTYAHNLFLEVLEDYGVVGLILLFIVLLIAWRKIRVAWNRDGSVEVLWVICLILFQIIGQQFSLNIFWSFFWTAILIPYGLYLQELPRRTLLESSGSKTV